MKLLRKAKFDCCININVGNLTDNCKFLETVKQLYSDKVHVILSVTLIEDGKIISTSKESETAEVFNNFLVNTTGGEGIAVDVSLLLPQMIYRILSTKL